MLNVSTKNLDGYQRWRSKNVSFRLSPEEAEQLDKYVQLSGMTKQDYLADRVLQREVVVQSNPRVFKALRNELNAICATMLRMESWTDADAEFRILFQQVLDMVDQMKEDTDAKKGEFNGIRR